MKFKTILIITLALCSMALLSGCNENVDSQTSNSSSNSNVSNNSNSSNNSSNSNSTSESNHSQVEDYKKDPADFPEELSQKIKEDYFQYLNTQHSSAEWKLEDIYIQQYFGNYSGYEIVYISSSMQGYDQAFRDVEIAGYTITFSTGQEVYAYKDSEFYTLKEAYDGEHLTKADVYEIGKKVGHGFLENNPNP